MERSLFNYLYCNSSWRDYFKKIVFTIFIFHTVHCFLSLNLALAATADKNTIESSSARALGMGNAAINSERGPYSIFYNPANIAAKDTGGMVQLANVSLEAGEGLITQSQKGGSINFTSLGDLYPTLRSNPNSIIGARYSIYPNVTIRNLSLGVLYEVNRRAMYNLSDDSLYVYSRDRFGPTLAYSLRFFSGIFRIGAMVQYLSETDADGFVNQPIDASTVSWDKYSTAGAGFVKTGEQP